jgi:uncharacterized protein YceH (UPF0502 family)
MLDALTDEQLRVLGSLVEKEATVPDTYPMTLKGLQAACNQRNNREPVTDHDTATIQRTLDELKAAGYVRFVHPSHGARTTKYRHVLDDRLGLDGAELALLSVLMLRGAQTTGELRTRTERAHEFPDVDTVVEILEDLAGRDEPLVVLLPRQPGQKETRWMHLLGGEVDPAQLAEWARHRDVASAPASGGLAARVDALERRLTALESAIADLDVTPSSP